MTSRSVDSAIVNVTVRELLGLVGAKPNGGGVPLTDPSVNVKELVELRASYEKELREQAARFQTQLDVQKDRANELALQAEAGRINALRAADAASVAAALVQVTTAATTLATATAATNDTTAKAIVALQLIASSSGGTLSGREAQQAQNRQTSQWAVGLGIAAGGTILGLLVLLAPHVHFG